MWLATTETRRLPATGPMVQKPMAEARPAWGLKSRTSAGVQTRTTPSTKPMAMRAMTKVHSLGMFGTAKSWMKATMPTPATTRLARPIRSPRWAMRAEMAPKAEPTMVE